MRRLLAVGGLVATCLTLTGCLGWGDIFAPHQHIVGPYSLMEGQGDLYLMVRDDSGSVAGPLYKIGWNEQYIIYTDANRPEPWNVIDVRNYTRVSISEALRTSSRRFQAIRIMEPAEAWRGGGLKRR